MMSERADQLVAGVLAGDRRSIARALTAVENETAEGAALLRAVHPHLGRARVLGVTGPPGAGKSTLVNRLIGAFLARGGPVAVLAVDPSSPISGGAVLGDRLRMGEHSGSEAVFIRSLASRGHLGGLSATCAQALDVLDAAGFGHIIVETVGAGQSEVEIAEVADTRIVVCPPGLGDDVQAIKAGVLEIADIFVVNKSDSPLAGRVERELKAMLALRAPAEWTPPVVMTTALTGEGIGELVESIGGHFRFCDAAPRRRGGVSRIRRVLAQLAGRELARRLRESESAELANLCEALETGAIGSAEAAARAIRLAGDWQ